MTTNDTFVHLHVHTEFSLLDGLSRINKVVSRAQELEMPALAITDHGTMFGVMDFYNACKDADVKPIIGLEAYLARRKMTDRDPQLDKRPYHLLLLAKNKTGYKNLLKLSSEAQLNGYYYRPRIDWDLLAEHSEGLIATSGCLASVIPSEIMNGNDEFARELIGQFSELFGPDHFYLELQDHDIDVIKGVNQWLVDYNRSNHTDVGLLVTNDVHYVHEEDYDAHDTLLCIQTSALKSEENRLKLSDNSYFLTSKEQVWRQFGEVPDAIHNSVKIAEMCDVDLDRGGYHLPVFPVPEGYDAASYLRYLCEKGMDWRFGSRKDDLVLQKRLDRELNIIHEMGFDTYFLIVWDLCEYARYADIWWNVRGSGAGSLAAYCLGITNIDPMENSLLFERFLNPGRVSMPDIDLDYPDDQRADMIAYSALKYGEEKVAAIITFGTLGAKAAVRDVGRALNVAIPEVNRAAALIPQEAKQKPIGKYVETIPELQSLYDTDPQIRQVLDVAKQLQGVSRHASTHAAGVIIADKPLVEYLPLHRLTGKDASNGALKAVTQFPMETCESIGLLKVDFLGLSTLTIMRRAAELVEKHHGVRYNIGNIPYRHEAEGMTDKDREDLDKAFELLGRGETTGVFQVESSGMQQMLREMKPKVFQNVIAAISLYRPGPMDFIPQYNRRLHGEEEPEYRHQKLEGILAQTYGIIIYQEQIMQIAGELFGYELGEADLMRRAVSKKKEEELKKHREIFLERGPDNGIDVESAGKIFDDIEFFANYGFNRSHATDYAMITVQTAFLKAHYPVEYMTAMLMVHSDDSAKLATFLEECRRLHIPILPPDVNYSDLNFAIQEDPKTGMRGIRFGLAAIKNASGSALTHVINAREKDGPFDDLVDLCQRVNLHEVGKRTIESLIKVGAMAKFGKRAQLLNVLERMVGYSTTYHRDKQVGQISMFGEETGIADESLTRLPDVPDPSPREMLGWEKTLLGLYVTGRLVDRHRDALSRGNTANIQELKQEPQAYQGLQVQAAGEIVDVRKLYTKKNEAMCVIQLEDWHDSAATIEVVLFPGTWTKVLHGLESGALRGFEEGEIVAITGEFDASRGEPQIKAGSVTQDFEFMVADQDTQTIEYQRSVWHDPVTDEPVANGYVNGYSNGHHAPENDDGYDDAPPPSFEPPPWVDDVVDTTNDHNGHEPDDDFYEDFYDEETGEVAKPETEDDHRPPSTVALATQGAIAVLTPSVEPQFTSIDTKTDTIDGDDDAYLHDPDTPHPLDAPTEQTAYEPVKVLVYMKRTGNDMYDRRKMQRLHGTFMECPGKDHFSIIVQGDAEIPELTIEFPNHKTGYSEELFYNLLAIVEDKNNIEVVPLD